MEASVIIVIILKPLETMLVFAQVFIGHGQGLMRKRAQKSLARVQSRGK